MQHRSEVQCNVCNRLLYVCAWLYTNEGIVVQPLLCTDVECILCNSTRPYMSNLRVGGGARPRIFCHTCMHIGGWKSNPHVFVIGLTHITRFPHPCNRSEGVSGSYNDDPYRFMSDMCDLKVACAHAEFYVPGDGT